MLKRTRSRTGAATRTARKRNLPRRSPRPKPGLDRPDLPDHAQTGPANSMDWADPLSAEERRALEAGWSFVE